jgi:ligand-binding sensor domain-containing protein
VTAFDKVFAESPSSCPAAYRWYFDSRSWLWIHDGVNLFRYNGQAWQSAHQPNVGPIQDMTTGPDGRVWVVGDRGVAVYDPMADKQP